MHHSFNEERETTHEGRDRLSHQEEIRTLMEKETYKYLGILEADIIKQVEMKGKIKMSISGGRESYLKQNSIAGTI